MFTLTIHTDNAAFRDDDDDDDTEEATVATRAEVARILRQAARHLESGRDSRKLQDYNGNTVGSYDLEA